MSLYKDASLAMIPSAYKDGKLYSIRPTDGSGDFTFSRGSNLAATRVDVNGLIEKGRENLLLRSNAFDNAYWNKSDSSIVIGQADPNGGSNAFKIVENTNTAYHRIFGNYTMVSGNVYTTSVTAKAAGRNYLTLSNNVSAGTCIFNLIDGSISLQESNVISASTTSLGGGWYRCEMVAVGDKSGTYNVFIGCDDDGLIAPYTGDGTSGVLIYQSQLEAGLVATDYIETGASTAQAGILEDMPRLDYSGGASCPALLLEPQRTNKITNSEYINTTTFNYNNGLTINNNEATSPEGIENAAKIIATTANSRHELRTSLATASGYDMVSCFVKASGYNYVQLASWADPANYVNFDLTDGSIGSVGVNGPSIKDIEDYGNGWYRIYANVQASGGGIIGIGIVTSASAGWAQSFTGNGTDGLLIWGVQLEAASYPTSYIPTYGSSVTRSYDNISDSTFTALPNADFTIFFEVDEWVGSQGNNYQLRFFDASGNRSIQFRNRPEGWRWLVVNDEGSGAYLNTGNYTYTKMAVRYNGTNYQLFADGSAVGSAFAAMDTAILNYFDSYPIGIMGIKQMVTFPTALTDSECIALTTL